MSEILELDYQVLCHNNELQKRLERAQQDLQLEIKSHEIGADREQWWLESETQSCWLFVEHLSESVWLEQPKKNASNRLQVFYNLLICQ